MILSYRDKRPREFAEGKRVRQFEPFAVQAERRLEILDAAPHLDALRLLPSNCFEVLKGERKGQYSVRVNRQWRVCFRWPAGDAGPSDVEIVDYH